MPIPNNISKSHILTALIQMDEVTNLRHSTGYDLLYEGRRYPPKEVIRYASLIANRFEYDDHSGGDETNNFLIQRGFSIVIKNTFTEIGLNYTKNGTLKGASAKDSNDVIPFNETSIAEIEQGDVSDTEKEQVIKARIGQSTFKKKLLVKQVKCSLCGLSDERFLIASHIKPWSESSNSERLDVNNGLLLCPNHDRAFDKGYISFDDKGNILISSTLSNVACLFLNITDGYAINLNEFQKQYIAWHREHKFVDNLNGGSNIEQ